MAMHYLLFARAISEQEGCETMTVSVEKLHWTIMNERQNNYQNEIPPSNARRITRRITRWCKKYNKMMIEILRAI